MLNLLLPVEVHRLPLAGRFQCDLWSYLTGWCSFLEAHLLELSDYFLFVRVRQQLRQAFAAAFNSSTPPSLAACAS